MAAGGGVASPLADDGAERPVAGGCSGAARAARSLANDGAEGGAVANCQRRGRRSGGGGARSVASAADEDASVGPITEGARPVADASAVRPVAEAASADNAAIDSQTGQTLPPQGWIAGTTQLTMPA